MTTDGGAPPANWYPDPADPKSLRYWDGARWSEHVAPLSGPLAGVPGAAPSGQSTGPSEPIHWLVPVGRSGESIAAGYLGFLCLLLAIFAIFPFAFTVVLPIAGLTIWLAVRAIGKAESGGHGRGRAVFGLTCAGLAVVASTVGVFATFAAGGS